jgi:hypothetical protein
MQLINSTTHLKKSVSFNKKMLYGNFVTKKVGPRGCYNKKNVTKEKRDFCDEGRYQVRGKILPQIFVKKKRN